MHDAEIRLECLKLAVDQAKREQLTGDAFRDTVVKIQTWLYYHIIAGPELPTPETANAAQVGKQKRTRTPNPFE